MSKESILTVLRSRGHRMTKARESLVALFSKHERPLSAADTHDLLKKSGLTVNAATVYRELKFLAEEEVLTMVQFKDGIARFELASLPHHHHLVCNACNTITDISVDHDLHSVEKTIERTTGFSVAEHALEFYGTCSRCS